MISTCMRIILISAGILNYIYIILRIKKSKIAISESIFWVGISFIVVLFGIFPSIPIYFAILVGVESPVNLVYLFFIAILYIKVFHLSIKNFKLEIKMNELISKLSLMNQGENNLL